MRVTPVSRFSVVSPFTQEMEHTVTHILKLSATRAFEETEYGMQTLGRDPSLDIKYSQFWTGFLFLVISVCSCVVVSCFILYTLSCVLLPVFSPVSFKFVTTCFRIMLRINVSPNREQAPVFSKWKRPTGRLRVHSGPIHHRLLWARWVIRLRASWMAAFHPQRDSLLQCDLLVEHFLRGVQFSGALLSCTHLHKLLSDSRLYCGLLVYHKRSSFCLGPAEY